MKKGYCIAYPVSREVVVLVRIKEMCVRVPENWLSLTVIESISVDRISILPVVIVPERMIIES